ncbi:hypothetical protein JTB14_005686 [Gonioctena quinquepunctata]|nr:hypothetical protein JTB14_005686 [Gonioctena quinquepunctata]
MEERLLGEGLMYETTLATVLRDLHSRSYARGGRAIHFQDIIQKIPVRRNRKYNGLREQDWSDPQWASATTPKGHHGSDRENLNICAAFISDDVSRMRISLEGARNRLRRANRGLLTQEGKPTIGPNLAPPPVGLSLLVVDNVGRQKEPRRAGQLQDRRRLRRVVDSLQVRGREDPTCAEVMKALVCNLGGGRTGPRSGGRESELRKWSGGSSLRPWVGISNHTEEEENPGLGLGMGTLAPVGEFGDLFSVRGIVSPNTT